MFSDYVRKEKRSLSSVSGFSGQAGGAEGEAESRKRGRGTRTGKQADSFMFLFARSVTSPCILCFECVGLVYEEVITRDK